MVLVASLGPLSQVPLVLWASTVARWEIIPNIICVL